MSQKSCHYPRLCLGICLGRDLRNSDFDTIISRADRSFELAPQDHLEQLDPITMQCGDRLQGWIGCISQRVEKP
jgi:hypothetical protein